MWFGDYYSSDLRSWKSVIRILLLKAALAANVPGAVITSKFVCNGGSILLFEKQLVSISGKEAALYFGKNGTIVLIAAWTSNGFTFEENAGKVFRDVYGNLWIGSINRTDEGLYTVQHRQDQSIIQIYHQELTVLIAPTTNCKPIIKRTDSTLVASLEDTDCGKPEPSVYFVQYPHMSYASKTVAMLSPGTEAGTYIACMKTPALRCVTSLTPFDFCTYFTIPESTNERRRLTDMITEIQIVVILNFVTTFVVMTLLMSYIIMCIKRNSLFHFQPVQRDQQKSPTHQGSQKSVDLQCRPQREYQPLISHTSSLQLQKEGVPGNDLRARKVPSKNELKAFNKLFGE